MSRTFHEIFLLGRILQGNFFPCKILARCLAEKCIILQDLERKSCKILARNAFFFNQGTIKKRMGGFSWVNIWEKNWWEFSLLILGFWGLHNMNRNSNNLTNCQITWKICWDYCQKIWFFVRQNPCSESNCEFQREIWILNFEVRNWLKLPLYFCGSVLLTKIFTRIFSVNSPPPIWYC